MGSCYEYRQEAGTQVEVKKSATWSVIT